jgi:hypothetical protein
MMALIDKIGLGKWKPKYEATRPLGINDSSMSGETVYENMRDLYQIIYGSD